MNNKITLTVTETEFEVITHALNLAHKQYYELYFKAQELANNSDDSETKISLSRINLAHQARADEFLKAKDAITKQN